MKTSEKNERNQKEALASSENENEFQELDNEIEKVIRGEASLEEDETEKNSIDLNTSSTSETSGNLKNNINNNNKLNQINNSNIIKFDTQFSLKDKNFQNISFNPNSININKNMEKLKTNFQSKNSLINNNLKRKKNKHRKTNDGSQNLNYKNNPMSNLNQYNKKDNQIFPQNLCNYNINYSLNRNISNGCNNTYNFMNNSNIYEYINNNSNNPNFNNSQINGNNININNIINNQFYNPMNINFQLNNANIPDSNLYFQYDNNKLNFNGLNNNINNNFRPFLQNDVTLNSLKNINNIANFHDKIVILKYLENQLKNQNKIIDFLSNNNINNVNNQFNNQNLSFVNNNFNFKNNMENDINCQIQNIPIKKSFNPDSEKDKNIINLMDIFLCKDLRTTVMIKNIPNKYTISSFLDEINVVFKDTYDIFYLPIDYINKCNLGFAFINFVEPFHIILFYELYRGKKWKRFNSDKKCELLYGKYQGRQELISHFEKGKVLLFDSEDKRPLILPVPNPLPKIKLPCYYLDLFVKLYPNIYYEINNINKDKNRDCSSLSKIFSINGNFHKN